MSEIGILLPNNQRQHRTLHIQKDVLRIVLVTVPRVSRSCELFPDGLSGVGCGGGEGPHLSDMAAARGVRCRISRGWEGVKCRMWQR